jgi:hypothetical protein
VKCSCGWVSGDVGGRHSEQDVVNEHRMAVITRHLNLFFGEDDD